MRTYVKLLGPPILKGIKVLERIAVDMPEVCMMHQSFVEGLSPRIARDIGLETERGPSVGAYRYHSTRGLMEYFRSSGVTITQERCDSIISDSGQALGDYDFFFEWFEKPSLSQLNDLTKKIDDAMAELGLFYTITSKK